MSDSRGWVQVGDSVHTIGSGSDAETGAMIERDLQALLDLHGMGPGTGLLLRSGCHKKPCVVHYAGGGILELTCPECGKRSAAVRVAK